MKNLLKLSTGVLTALGLTIGGVSAETKIGMITTLSGGGAGLGIDVRDGLDINQTGTIKNALRIPRGFIEFAADPETAFHNNALQKDADIVLVCGAGGMAALTGKTLLEMGFQSVSNVGGFSSWKDAGGPVE